MTIDVWLVVFHRRKLWKRAFGHVEVIGITDDGTWVFFNPSWEGSLVFVSSDEETVTLALEATTKDAMVLRVDGLGQGVPPIFPLQNCATICGHILGYSAFTPGGLRRKLLKNGAKVVHDGWSEGKQREQDPA